MFFFNLALYILFFIVIGLLIADALAALITSQSTFHPYPSIQNVLYILAFNITLSWIISKNESKEIEPFQPPLRFAAIILFVISSGICFYVGITLLTDVVYNTVPDEIEFILPGDWKPIAYLHASVLLIGSVYGILECIINVSTFLDWGVIGTSKRPLKVKKTDDACDPKKKQRESCRKGFYWAYRFVQFSCLALVLTLIINSLVYSSTIIWQQSDSPHLLLVLSIALSFHVHWINIRALWGFILLFALSLSVSISQLFFEVERTNQDAQWLDVNSYIGLFNTTGGVSLPIQNKYKIVTSSSVFIDAFAQGSNIQHIVHVVFVSLSTSLFVSVFCIAIGKCMSRNGREKRCPSYY